MSHRRFIPDKLPVTYSFGDPSHLRSTPEAITRTETLQIVEVNAAYYDQIALPSSPVDGMQITIKDTGNASPIQPITITGTIDEGIGPVTITGNGDSLTFVWMVDDAGQVADRWNVL